MALPTSTIVLGLLTALPFGLAIKDTVSGKPALDMRSDDEREAEEAIASMERAQREYEEQEAKTKAQLEAAIDELIPIATPARLATPYKVNRELPELSNMDRLEELGHAVVTPARNGDGTLKSLSISFPQHHDADVCSLVRHRLDEAWGSPERTYANGDDDRRHYAASEPHERITFINRDYGRCELVLEGYVGARDFVNKTEASTIPVWAVGKPAAKLVDKLGGDAFSDATQIRWTRPGVGAGLGETELYARVVKGKVVTITAKFQTGESTIGVVAEHMVADFGEPTESDPVIWEKAKISLATVDDSAGDYLLVAGDPLPDEE